MKTDEAEIKQNSLHGETEKSFFWNGKSLALVTHVIARNEIVMAAVIYYILPLKHAPDEKKKY